MDVFVYGTLTSPARAREVLDAFAYVGAARLDGLHAVEGRYPTLAPGGTTGGRLLRTDEVAALDAYERVDDDLYARVSVPLRGSDEHPDDAAVYVGDPARLDAEATWPGPAERSLRDRVRAYLDDHDVRVVVDAAL